MILREEKVRIIWGSVWTSKNTGKDFGVFDFKNSNNFKENIFINQPSQDIIDLLSELNDLMGKEVTITTSINIED